MKQWRKTQDGPSVKYRLTKDANPIWYATVFMRDGRWTFEFGRRIKDGDPTREHYSYADVKKWRSVATAKTKALWAIRQKA